MSQETIIANTEVSFKDFLFKNKRNRTILWLAAAAIVIQFAVFKYFYPFASYIHGDSFLYIEAAYFNYDINTHMIGYSKFLRLFSTFSKSDLLLTAFQYLFLQTSALYLAFTIFYFYNPRIQLKITLLIFLVLNPLFLYLSNLISSDNLFLSFSLIWFTTLLWIINKASNQIIICHTIILLLAFTIRYNALFYPFVTLLAILISQMTIKLKFTAVILCILLCGSFITFTSYQYKKLTNHWQYSPFSGWQMANNAMYTYRYINSENRKPVPKRFAKIDLMIRDYFDSTRDVKKHPVEQIIAGTFYMWSPGLPLQKYCKLKYPNDTTNFNFKNWASLGPFYSDYGKTIILNYPIEFIKHFIWPNANKFFTPPLEYLRSYNSERNYTSPNAKNWFSYESIYLKTRTKNSNYNILNLYPILSGMLNLLFTCTIIYLFSLKSFRKSGNLFKCVTLTLIIWLLNAGFTILASSAALRFQTFPIIIIFTFELLLIGLIPRLVISNESDTTNAQLFNSDLKTVIANR
jgi:hypothetical protein